MTDSLQSLWVEHEEWQPDNKPNDYFNAQVTTTAGLVYAVSVLVLKYVHQSMEEESEGLQCERFLVCPDMIVEKSDRASLESIFSALVESGRMPQNWLVPRPSLSDRDP